MERRGGLMSGSDKLERVVQKESINGDLGKTKIMELSHEKCMECGFEGDLFGENDKLIEEALSTLSEDYVNEALNFFIENKISFAGIERAVGLPQRTLTKWKNGISSPTAAGIALLKYLRIFPWLIEVAENKFDFNISQKIFIGEAISVLLKSMNFNSSDIEKNGYSATAGNFTANIIGNNFFLTQETNFSINYIWQGNS